MELNDGRPMWPQFIQLLNTHFGPPLMNSPIGESAILQCTGTADEFCKCFITLSCRDISLTEAQQIQLFITGLGDPLRTNVALQQPSSLDDAIIFAARTSNATCHGTPASHLNHVPWAATIGWHHFQCHHRCLFCPHWDRPRPLRWSIKPPPTPFTCC
jgi:hypothetical protein